MYALSQENTLTPRRKNYEDDDDESTRPPPVPDRQHPLVPDEPGASETKEKRSSRRHHSHKRNKSKTRKKRAEYSHSSQDAQKKAKPEDVVSHSEPKAPPLYPVGVVANNKIPPTDGTNVASCSIAAARMGMSDDSTSEKLAYSPSYNVTGTKYNAATLDYERKVASSGMITTITPRTAGMKRFDQSSSEKSLDPHYYDDSQGQSSLSDINGDSFTSKPGAIAIGPNGQEIDVESQLYVSNVSNSLELQAPQVIPSEQREAVEARCVSDNEVVRDHADEIAELVQRKLMTNVAVPVEVNTTPPTPEPSGLLSRQRKRRTYLILALLLMIVIAIVVGLSVALTKEDPKEATSPTPTPLTEREDAFRSILEPISGELLVDEGTSQHQALKWIANDDSANMTVGIDSNQIITTRYVASLLYFAFEGKGWANPYNFLSAGDVCTWKKNDLSSEIPFGIGCGSNLSVETFKLPENNLKGSIPHEIGYLSTLTNVDMTNNTIEGDLTSLEALTRLQYLDLENNILTGNLPMFLLSHDRLISLYLSHNRLEGTIHSSLGTSSELAYFWIRGNDFTGSIPSAVGQSSSLQSVNLMSNHLSGTIPDFLSSSTIQYFLTASNEVTGTIPTTIGNLANLKIVYLSENPMEGTIPTELGKCRRLEYVAFENNNLVGDFGVVIDSLPSSLLSIDVSLNNIQGRIATQIGLLNKVTYFDIQDNQISGPLPSEFGLLSNLELLNVAYNEMSGSVPADIASLSQLATVRIQGNNFYGSVGAFCGLDLEWFSVNTCTDPRMECNCCTHCCDQGEVYCEQV